MNSSISREESVIDNSVYHETKLCIIIDSRTPIILKVPLNPKCITLGQFKTVASLHDTSFKFYFKSQDSEFGIVKEEVVDDDSVLPVDGDRVVAWVISQHANQSLVFEPGGSRETIDDTYPQNNVYMRSEQQQQHQTNLDLPPPLPPSRSTQNREFTHENFNLIRVQLKLDNYNFLGLTLVGPSDEISSSDKGIYVSEIAENSVVEQNGQIEIGDRVLQINDSDLTKISNDEAVSIFRSYVERRGAINLVLLRTMKSYQDNKRRFTLPREYANPIGQNLPANQTESRYLYEDLPIPEFGSKNEQSNHKFTKRSDHSTLRSTHSLPRSITPRSLYATSNFESIPLSDIRRLPLDSRSVYEPSTPTSLRQIDIALHCTRDDIRTVYAALCNDAISLEIKDREWLRVIVKNAFLGTSLVKWLSRNVYGFSHKREVKRYANQMLSLGLIRNPITSGTFSEKCYYTLS